MKKKPKSSLRSCALKKFRSGELHYVDHPKFGMLISAY